MKKNRTTQRSRSVLRNAEIGPAPPGCAALVSTRAGDAVEAKANAVGPRPGGTYENSPTFQRWVQPRRMISPEGTADKTVEKGHLSRPFGTHAPAWPNPTLKRWATPRCPFGTRGTGASARADRACPASSDSGPLSPTLSKHGQFDKGRDKGRDKVFGSPGLWGGLYLAIGALRVGVPCLRNFPMKLNIIESPPP